MSIRKQGQITLTVVMACLLWSCGDDDPPTGTDTTPPTVVSTSPADGATGVSTNANISATFSEDMNADSISNTTFTLNNGVTGVVSYSNKVAACDPTAELSLNTTYTATISTGVMDQAGNAMAQPKTWSFTTETSTANTWETTFWSGTETGAYSVAQGSNGNYLIGGYTYASPYNVFLAMADSTGDSLAVHTLGAGAAWVVLPTADGGFIIAGGFSLIKVDNSGNLTWSKTYDVDGSSNPFQPLLVRSVALSMDGGYVITGTTQSVVHTVPRETDVYILKTNSNGDSVSAHTFNRPGYDLSLSVVAASDGGYLIAGYTSPRYDESDVYIIKTDGSCDSVWAKTYDNNTIDEGRFVIQTPDGGYLITGWTGVGDHWRDCDTCDVYLLKIDGDGDYVWQNTYLDTTARRNSAGNWLTPTSDGGFVIAADYSGGSLIKVDASGDQLWMKHYSQRGARSVIEADDGGLVFVGSTTKSYYRHEAYVVKVKANGEF